MTNCRGNPIAWEVPRQHNPAYNPTALAFLQIVVDLLQTVVPKLYGEKLKKRLLIPKKYVTLFTKVGLHLYEDA